MQGDSYKNWCPRPDSNWEAEARDFKSLVFAISPRGHKKKESDANVTLLFPLMG